MGLTVADAVLDAGLGGDVPGLARLVVTDLSGNDQWQADVALQSRYFDAEGTAKLYYPATDFTPLGTSTDTGTAIRNTDLVPTWQAILKSEIDATNAALTHVGSFRLKARLIRPTGNTGAVSVRLEWGEGDYRRRTLNDVVAYGADDREGVDTVADLGLVHISPESERWEFRVLAKSTVAGDEIDVKDVTLFPTGASGEKGRYIELAGRLQFENPSSFSARDEFDQTAGALTGKTAPVGGTWAGAGDADDFQVEATGHTAQRTVVSDTDLQTGRYAIVTPVLTATVAEAQTSRGTLTGGSGSTFVYQGVLARYTNTSNWLMAVVATQGIAGPEAYSARLIMRVAGTVTTLATFLTGEPLGAVRLSVDASGRYAVWVYSVGGQPGAPVIVGSTTVLATGGALASGNVGIYDVYNGSTALDRTITSFVAFVPTFDAAVYASQSLTLTHEGATREDSTGAFSGPVSVKRGKYLTIPPAGQEGRSTRLVVRPYRNDPVTMGQGVDVADDISVQLFVTPRGLVAPES